MDLPDAFRPTGFMAAIGSYLKAHPDFRLKAIDRDEYPCLALAPLNVVYGTPTELDPDDVLTKRADARATDLLIELNTEHHRALAQ